MDPRMMSKEYAMRYLRQDFRFWTKGIREEKLPAKFYINFIRLAVQVRAARDEAASYAGIDALVYFLNEVEPLNGIGWMRVAHIILTKSLQMKKNAEEKLDNYLGSTTEPYNTNIPLEKALAALGDWQRPGDFQLCKLLVMKRVRDFEELCHYSPPARTRRWSMGSEDSARIEVSSVTDGIG
jgi:hypothetical protein